MEIDLGYCQDFRGHSFRVSSGSSTFESRLAPGACAPLFSEYGVGCLFPAPGSGAGAGAVLFLPALKQYWFRLAIGAPGQVEHTLGPSLHKLASCFWGFAFLQVAQVTFHPRTTQPCPVGVPQHGGFVRWRESRVYAPLSLTLSPA